MERTKVISVVNNTAKAPKNQAFWRSASEVVTRFRVRYRYDRFDTTPDGFVAVSATAPLF